MTASRRLFSIRTAGLGALLAVWTLCGSALAQASDDEASASSSAEDEFMESEDSEGSEDSEESDDLEESEDSVAPTKGEKKADPGANSDVALSWNGSLEVDVGLAQYEAEDESVTDDQLYNFRGRFVLAPLLEIPLGEDLFFAATGQVVTWVKNNQANPLLNADDVWGMFGGTKSDGSRLWDIQMGRFEAFPVYQKFGVIDHDPRLAWIQGESTGAFDLFTLEDRGALCRPPLTNNEYCVDIYEVNHILLRDEVGSVAMHAFPLDGLAIEAHGKFGQVVSTNHLGLRVAMIYSPVPWLQLSGGGEMRQAKAGSPAKQQSTIPAPTLEEPTATRTVYSDCTDCGRRDRSGGGGGVVLRVPGLGDLKPELAFSYAFGRTTSWDGDAKPIKNNSPDVVSMGGYFQLGYKDFLVGGAGNNTQKDTPDGSSETHLQVAGYARYALQDRLSLKLVLTYAEGNRMSEAGNAREDIINTFTAARLRMKYLFNGL